MDYQINAKDLNIILLSSVSVVKQISGIDLIKKNIYTSFKSLSVNSELLLIKLSGDLVGDILIKFDNNLKETILKKFLEKYNLAEGSNKNIEHSAFKEIGNLITAKITNFLAVDNKKVEISSVIYLPSVDEIYYETIFVIEMKSEFGNLAVFLGIREIKIERSLSFIFYGFSEESMEEIINEFIPRGFEIYYAQTSHEFLENIKSKKFDIAVIDFYVINQDLNLFLKSYFSAINYKINLIFGVTKIDAAKFQGIPSSSDKYQLIGLFLKTFSIKEIIKYIYTILHKIGIKPDDRRKDVRVSISDKTRYFVSVNEKNLKFTARLIDISLGGFKAEFDNLKDIDENFKLKLTIGTLLKDVDLFLKYSRVKVSCKVVYLDDKYFSVSFVNLVDQDRNTISNAIFKILCNK